MKKIIFVLFGFFAVIVYFSFYTNNLKYSFYHWKNTYSLDKAKDKLYIKVLDINFTNKLEVLATSFKTKPKNLDVPVIYITNDAMKIAFVSELSNIVLKKLENLPFSFEEVQFDCDWSLSTRAKYFKFLKEIKKKLNKNISATIRLHQVKYFRKTGVPPVDYGLLMYYNMSKIGDFNTKNSILDNETARRYQYNFDIYPLKLKLALPLYSQAIRFRDKKPLDIFEGVKKSDLNDNFKKLEKNYYKVNKSFYFRGRYVYKGDVFRFEDSNYTDLQTALKDFFDIAKKPFNEVIFYTIKYKDKYDLKKLLKGL